MSKHQFYWSNEKVITYLVWVSSHNGTNKPKRVSVYPLSNVVWYDCVFTWIKYFWLDLTWLHLRVVVYNNFIQDLDSCFLHIINLVLTTKFTCKFIFSMKLVNCLYFLPPITPVNMLRPLSKRYSESIHIMRKHTYQTLNSCPAPWCSHTICWNQRQCFLYSYKQYSV